MLTIQELQALDDVVDSSQDTVLPNGKVVTQRPIGVRNFIRHMVKVFPSVRGQFVKPMKAMAPIAASLGEKATDEQFATAAGGVMGTMMGELIDARVEDGLDADIRFVALTLCKAATPQELKQVEAVVAGFSDAVFEALFAGAKKVTYGGETSAFFYGKVREALTKMEALESQA